MKVIVLIENTSKCSLCAEHGLSVYIEYNGMKYLLDTGASDTFSGNAHQLGIDLSDIDIAFLSHAHYDHAGRFETPKGLILLNSCSHGGIVNIVKEVQMALGNQKVYAVIGGFHMMHWNL